MMETPVNEFDLPSWIQLPSMSGGKFEQWVNSKLERASKRQLLGMLRPLAEEEVKVTGDDSAVSRIHLERLSCIKQAVSRLLGPEVFEPKYKRLIAHVRRLIEETRRQHYEDVPFVKIRQEAVGHGGFHHGVLATHFDRIRWVYDCGSWRKAGRAALSKCIDDFARQCAHDHKGHLELLFVSHFDVDHVNGLRRLLEAVPGKTGTVILPYLGSMGVFAVLCEAAADGRCPQDFIDQVVDPVRWFQELGVLRVIQVRPGAPPVGGELAPSPDLPPPDEVSPESSDDIFRSAILDANRKSIKMKRRRKDGAHEPAIAPPGTVLGVMTPTRKWVDWWFVPYAHPIPATVRKAVSAEAKRVVGVSVGSRSFVRRLTALLSSKSGVRKLKEAYHRSGLNDANSISLSLYTGPRQSERQRRAILLKDGTRSKKPAGWLLTGDAKLRNNSGQSPRIKFFGSFQKSTGMLMLPHHGSQHNFGEAILECVPDADLFVTANAEDMTRPNALVRKAAKLHGGKKIRKVTEARRNGITEISGPADLASDDFPYSREW
jgi:hypothetical protein